MRIWNEPIYISASDIMALQHQLIKSALPRAKEQSRKLRAMEPAWSSIEMHLHVSKAAIGYVGLPERMRKTKDNLQYDSRYLWGSSNHS
jgi:hypothetical protein